MIKQRCNSCKGKSFLTNSGHEWSQRAGNICMEVDNGNWRLSFHIFNLGLTFFVNWIERQNKAVLKWRRLGKIHPRFFVVRNKLWASLVTYNFLILAAELWNEHYKLGIKLGQVTSHGIFLLSHPIFLHWNLSIISALRQMPSLRHLANPTGLLLYIISFGTSSNSNEVRYLIRTCDKS